MRWQSATNDCANKARFAKKCSSPYGFLVLRLGSLLWAAQGPQNECSAYCVARVDGLRVKWHTFDTNPEGVSGHT